MFLVNLELMQKKKGTNVSNLINREKNYSCFQKKKKNYSIDVLRNLISKIKTGTKLYTHNLSSAVVLLLFAVCSYNNVKVNSESR